MTTVDAATGELVETVAPIAEPHAANPQLTAQHLRAAAAAFRELTAGLDLFTEVRRGGQQHLTVEGYQVAGLLVGITAVVTGAEATADGWRATAEARRLTDGQVVGAATALCTRQEQRWSRADEYALCSMASTRAQSRALRSVVAPLVKLADPAISTTAAEEMPAAAAEPETTTLTAKQVGLVRARARSANLTDTALAELVWQLAAPGRDLPDGDHNALLERALPKLPREHLDGLLDRIGGAE